MTARLTVIVLLVAGAVTAQDRAQLLHAVARGYYPGRSGEVFLIPEPGEILLRRPMGYYRFMHGSPWDYDARIPMVFYGKGRVRPGVRAEPAVQQDIAPTVLSILGVPPPATMTGRALEFILEPNASPPKVILVGVLDGMRLDYFEQYASEMPRLSRLRREGAWFTNARVNFVPSVTSAGHTTIATGTDPRFHGIAGNGFFDRSTDDGYRTLFEGLSPHNMMALGIADVWNLETDGKAVIVTNGTTPRATVSLGGHGGCTPNALRTTLAMFDYRSKAWVTNSECYRLPEYLADVRADVDDGRVFVMTAQYPRFQGDALLAMIEHEGVGEDAVTDLVVVNFKTPDYVGHNFGPDSEEMRASLAALDTEIGRVLDALEDYVAVFSADHGMPSEPVGDHARRFISDLHDAIHDAIDPDERAVVLPFDDTANLQLFLDKERLDELGKTPEDVARFVESLPYVRAAFGVDEVRNASRVAH